MPDEERQEQSGEAPAAAPELGRKFESRMSELDAEVARREEEARATPGEDAETSLRISKKERELYLFQHDNTGAKAGGLWGAEFAKRLEGRFAEDGEGFEKTGAIAPRPEDKTTHTLIVNVGELDRFNTEGGHEAGDRALEKGAETAETRVLEILRQAGVTDPDKYDIYRFGGNDFLVELRGVEKKTALGLRDSVEESRPEIIPGKDPLPLTAIELSQENIVAIVNEALAESGVEVTPKEARDLMIDTTRRLATVVADMAKFRTRAVRMKEKIGPPPAADLGEFWSKFMQKTFKGSEFEKLESLKEAAKDEAIFAVTVAEAARKMAEREFAESAKYESSVRRVLYEKLSSHVTRREIEIPEGIVSAGEKPKREKLELSGKAAIAEKQKATKEAAAAVEGLPAGSPERTRAEVAAREADLDFQIEKAKRDGLTGLPGRREYYRQLEKKIANGEKSGVVFVDMAFLKFFDKEGKGDTGDYALQKAAEIMERAIKELKLEATAFRYGGDEFTIQFSGDETVGKKIIEKAAGLAADMAPVAGSEKATSRFKPERLQFNYGMADTKLLGDAVRAVEKDPEVSVGQKEKLSSDNARAELMTKLADLGIEDQKAENRLRFIGRLLRAKEYGKDAKYTSQVDALIAYSEKAILGATKEDFDRWGTMKGTERIEAIRGFVAEKLAEKGKDKEHLDKSLGVEIRLATLEKQVEHVEKVADRFGRLYGKEHAKVVELEGRIRKMEQEREELIRARGKAAELAKAA